MIPWFQGTYQSLEVWMSLIKKTQRSSWLSLRPCNTSEMTLGRVLWVDLGILFDYEDHGREDRQSFESATLKDFLRSRKLVAFCVLIGVSR